MPTNPRGLIFDGALVSGVMSGAITVTTRITKPQPQGSATWLPALSAEPWLYFPDCATAFPRVLRCPYRVGQRRYVREKFMVCEVENQGIGNQFIVFPDEFDGDGEPRPKELRHTGGRKWGWHSPIHLPRDFARTWVEILSVRPARCQEITAEEILASGIRFLEGEREGEYEWLWSDGDYFYDTSGEAYAALWDRLNARGGFPWSGNFWTWRMTLRLTTEERAA